MKSELLPATKAAIRTDHDGLGGEYDHLFFCSDLNGHLRENPGWQA